MAPVSTSGLASFFGRRALGGVVLCACFCSGGAAVSKVIVAHIQCAVCKLAIKEARTYAKNNTMEEEDELSDMLENLCSPKKKEGQWLTKVDISKAGEKLALDRREEVGECRNECKAVQQSCAKAIAGKDDTIVSLLKESAGLSQLQNTVCEKPCKQKQLPSLDKWVDEEFKEDKDHALNTMMESMKGMPGMENMKMYNKDDIKNMAGAGEL